MDNITIIKEVLNYWYITEFLCQDKFPKWDEKDKKRAKKIKEQNAKRLRYVGLEETKKEEIKYLPVFCEVTGKSIYETIRNLAEEYEMTRWSNITIYIGRIQREFCIERIASLLGEADKRCEKDTEKIACISLQTGQDLRYIQGSFSLSPVIWTMKQLEGVTQNEKVCERLSRKIYEEKVRQYDVELVRIEEEEKKEIQESLEDAAKVTYLLDDENKYVRENVNSLNREGIFKLQEKVIGRYLPKEILNSKSDEDIDGMILEKGVWIGVTLYKDEKTQSNYEENEYQGLSRNYFASDLAMVLKQAESLSKGNKMHKKLADYIISKYSEYYEVNKGKRIDLLHIKEGEDDNYRKLFLNILNPANAPIGKWPSRYMPSFMQQVAINLAISDNEPIFSVNGPPGTGKTTLLKELIVHNIVERAKMLSKNEDPDKAFEHYKFKYGTKEESAYSRFAKEYHGFKNDKINDYGIVIASYNNNAVENISKELPMEEKIIKDMKPDDSDSEQMRMGLRSVEELFSVAKNPEADWFREIEENRQNKEKEKKEREGKEYILPRVDYHNIYFTNYAKELFGENAWGLIAAPLGKRKNINDFYWKVSNNLEYALCTKDRKKKRLEEYRKVRCSFNKQLNKVEKMQQELKNFSELEEKKIWHILTEKMMSLESEKNSLSNTLIKHKDKIKEMEKEYNSTYKQMDCTKKEYEDAIEKEKWLENELEKLRRMYSQNEEKITELPEINIFVKIFKPKKVKETYEKIARYNHEQTKLSKEIKNKEEGYEHCGTEKVLKKRAYNRLCNDADMIRKEWDEYKKKKEVIAKKYQNISSELEHCYEEIECWNIEYQKYLKEQKRELDTTKFQPLNDEYIKKIISKDLEESTEAHVTNPWYTAEYNREREILFYEALRLHEAFVLASTSCRDNIINLNMYWKKKKGDDGERVVFHSKDIEDSVEKLYQTLFLVVPVISTTFASVGSFFKDMGGGSLGTLIIDEAGQALPHVAIGALYRSRKAIIVGDPRQIEPVVTDDLQLLKKTYLKSEICKPYLAKNISVQTFADSLNPYGTWLSNEGETKEWVGCPLVVHRRCISPMFEISNELSYGGAMKNKTEPPKDSAKFVFTNSKWFEVKGREGGKKNHFVKGQADKVIDILENAFANSEKPEIFVISPFTTVVSGVRHQINEYLLNNPDSSMYGKVDMEWQSKYIGTVHTFQGKEAKEVIFVLGCDTSKEAEGAIGWVNKNIVNVAVTRAKFRLYVIGDVDAWKKSSVLTVVLDRTYKEDEIISE